MDFYNHELEDFEDFEEFENLDFWGQPRTLFLTSPAKWVDTNSSNTIYIKGVIDPIRYIKVFLVCYIIFLVLVYMDYQWRRRIELEAEGIDLNNVPKTSITKKLRKLRKKLKLKINSKLQKIKNLLKRIRGGAVPAARNNIARAMFNNLREKRPIEFKSFCTMCDLVIDHQIEIDLELDEQQSKKFWLIFWAFFLGISILFHGYGSVILPDTGSINMNMMSFILSKPVQEPEYVQQHWKVETPEKDQMKRGVGQVVKELDLDSSVEDSTSETINTPKKKWAYHDRKRVKPFSMKNYNELKSQYETTEEPEEYEYEYEYKKNHFSERIRIRI